MPSLFTSVTYQKGDVETLRDNSATAEVILYSVSFLRHKSSTMNARLVIAALVLMAATAVALPQQVRIVLEYCVLI